jgi:hypothetical protein
MRTDSSTGLRFAPPRVALRSRAQRPGLQVDRKVMGTAVCLREYNFPNVHTSFMR